MTTHSSILAWRIPWTVSSSGSQSQRRLSDFHFQGGRGKQREKQSTDHLEDGRSLIIVCSTNESENFRLL